MFSSTLEYVRRIMKLIHQLKVNITLWWQDLNDTTGSQGLQKPKNQSSYSILINPEFYNSKYESKNDVGMVGNH